MRLHHLLNAIDGLPANDIAAAWAFVREGDAPFPCALADGLATALFVTSPDRLRERFRFDCAFIDANGGAHASPVFPRPCSSADPHTPSIGCSVRPCSSTDPHIPAHRLPPHTPAHHPTRAIPSIS